MLYLSLHEVYRSPISYCSPKINFNIIFPFTVVHPSCCLLLGYPTTSFYAYVVWPMFITFPTHLILLDLIAVVNTTNYNVSVQFFARPVNHIAHISQYCIKHSAIKHTQPAFFASPSSSL